MRYVTLGDTFYFKFSCRAFSTGLPTTPAGPMELRAYPDGSTTELSAGITVSAGFDSRAGLVDVAIVATSGSGYAANTYYAIVVSTGTVDGVSVVGEKVYEFFIGPCPADVKMWLGSSPNALVSSRVDASVGAIAQTVKDDLVNQMWATAVRSVTSVSSPVGVASNYDKGNYTLSTTAVSAVADGWLDRDMSTGADSGSTTVRTPRQALRFLRNKWSIGAGTATLTVTKEDDSTASWTTALATSSTAAPVVGSDPAGP